MLRKFIFKTTPDALNSQEFGITALRVFAGLTMAIGHGLGKVPPGEQLISGVEAIGFPAPTFFAWCAGLSEFLGGILVAIGLFTRPAAIFLSLTMLVAAFGVHISDPFNVKELSLMYFFIFLCFAIRGSSRWSIDHQMK